MATAVQQKWPEARFGVGPVVENGFYYDVDLSKDSVSEDDLADLEQRMAAIVKADQPFEHFDLSIDKAIAWAKENKQPYKEELLNDLKRAGTTVAKDLDKEELGTITDGDSKVDEVSFYKNGDFTDLCRGPHVESTGKVGAFKLMRISGAYWRGKEGNPQMQRIYGVAFKTEKELRQHLNMLEEAKKRDHRKLGQEMDLFIVSPLVGTGLPLFTPRGTVLRNQLIAYSEELQRRIGYEAVWAPHIAKIDLYKASGHYDKYPERFGVTSTESEDEFMLKPMNCPHVSQLYASKPRSYRDLPLRYMETTTMYRDEKSGEMHGISRVRSLTQDDSHAFVRHDQIEAEINAIMGIVKEMYETLGLDLSVDLSFRDDGGGYFGEQKLWDDAQAILERVAKEQELDYKIELGEAAFYGPKIDIYVSDSLGRRWQCATVQLDYVQPERFELEYTAEDGTKQRPAMIHKAILGSIERFLSVYIEHTAGKFPVWLAPEQIRIVTVNQEEATVACAEDILARARALGLRATIDNNNESVGKKIRDAEVQKVPYTLVIGEKEIESGTVTPRVRRDISVQAEAKAVTIDEFLGTVEHETKSRVTRTSLHG
jgi:threonyl-tRNA synthetase